ncbi:MAG TPA: hypothetical protein VG733_04120 [Chthoniobacteraceae bacterium]|nr:hypothetical protein [Chthoniobacteraceae bacterium]
MTNALRIAVWLFVAALVMSRASAGDFSRQATFASVKEFVAGAQAFQPAVARNDLTPLFTTAEPGQEDDTQKGRPVMAAKTESAEVSWKSDDCAVVFVIARPPTQATPSCIGALFLLVKRNGAWSIGDVLAFRTLGIAAEVTVDLSRDEGGKVRLEKGRPVVVVTETSGGRHEFTGKSSSFTMDGAKFVRVRGK